MRYPTAISLLLSLSACIGGSSGGHSGQASTASVSTATVVGLVPLPGSQGVPTDAPIRVTFSEPLDPATLTAATFTLFRGVNQVAGTVHLEGLTAVFTPSDPLAFLAPYQASISSQVLDASGKPLPASFQWSFTTAPASIPLQIALTVPAAGETNVLPNTTITVLFDAALDPNSVDADSLTLIGPFGQVPGNLAQLAVNQLGFFPLAPLDWAQSYTATVEAGLASTTGNTLDADFSWTFTAIERCTFLSAGNDCNGNSVSDDIDILFGGIPDCNGNCIPDPCDIGGGTFGSSPQLSPFEFAFPQTFLLTSPPPAATNVRLDFSGEGNFATSTEVVNVSINGSYVGTIYNAIFPPPLNCSYQPGIMDASLFVPPQFFNNLTAGGDATILMAPSADVGSCPQSWIQVSVSYATELDCNGNGAPDTCDIASGFEADCNGNLVPDSCEFDCNLNGTPDECDIANGTSQDNDGDGVPDECGGAFPDGSFENQVASSPPAAPWFVVLGANHVINPAGGIATDGGMPTEGNNWCEISAAGSCTTIPGGPTSVGVTTTFSYPAGKSRLLFDAAFINGEGGINLIFNDWMQVSITDGVSIQYLYSANTLTPTVGTSLKYGKPITAVTTASWDLKALFPSSTPATVFNLKALTGNAVDCLDPSYGYLDNFRFAVP